MKEQINRLTGNNSKNNKICYVAYHWFPQHILFSNIFNVQYSTVLLNACSTETSRCDFFIGTSVIKANNKEYFNKTKYKNNYHTSNNERVNDSIIHTRRFKI